MVGVAVGVAVGVGVAVVADGDGEAPPHAAPLSVNAVGFAFVPLKVPLKPTVVVPPAAREPFQLALVTVTVSPLCDQVPFHPWVTCWLPGNVKPSVHALTAEPPLVIATLAVNPPGQLDVTE